MEDLRTATRTNATHCEEEGICRCGGQLQMVLSHASNRYINMRLEWKCYLFHTHVSRITRSSRTFGSDAATRILPAYLVTLQGLEHPWDHMHHDHPSDPVYIFGEASDDDEEDEEEEEEEEDEE